MPSSLSASCLCVAVLLLAGCGGPIASASRPSEHEREPPPAPTHVDAPVPAGTPLRSKPGLVALVGGPRVAPYQPTAGGLGGYHATVRVTNTGSAPVDVRDMRAQFAATRDGVAFPCHEHAGGEPRVREPQTLEPGQSHVFERDIDCGTTLLGHYHVSASVSFGGSGPDFAGTFPIDIQGGTGAGPKPYPGRPALHVALVGESIVRGMPLSAWREGAFAPVVVLTNASTSPILLGAVRVVLTMRAQSGASVPCESERVGKGSRPNSYGLDVWQDAPFRLEPGRSHSVPVPMRCTPRGDGDYRVEGFVVLGDGPIEDGAPVGPLSVKVTRDPALTVPQVTIPTPEEEERRRRSGP